MKVLVASHVLSRGRGGGVAARAVAVAQAIGREGAAVRLVGTDVHLDRADRDELDGLDVALIRSGLTRFPLPLVGPARLARLVGWADVVVIFSHWTILNAAVYMACRRLEVPHVVCPCGALPVRGRSQAIKRIYDAAVGRRLVREAAACVATTPLERRQLQSTQSTPARMVVIPNAVEVPDRPGPDAGEAAASADFRRAHGLGTAPVVLFMGRFNAIKGPDLLVEAFARIAPRFPAPLLVVAGPDGGMHRGLVELAARRGISDRVRFAGRIDHGLTPAAYRAATLLVVPSRSEAMSLVAIEAGAVGTPVLLTDACGFDVGGDVGGGLTVSATIDGLAGGLERLLADPLELPNMGARLRAHVAAHYVWPVVGRQWFELCVEVAGAGGRPLPQ
ncbi:MAG: glycosyltransferase [Vicinamibacteria bacterium]